MIDIVQYISQELKNPIAAERLAIEMVEAAEKILIFPYAAPVYHPIRSLKHEYRKILVQNYLIFQNYGKYLIIKEKSCRF